MIKSQDFGPAFYRPQPRAELLPYEKMENSLGAATTPSLGRLTLPADETRVGCVCYSH